MNRDIRKKVKNDFEKDFSKLINKAVFKKIMENVRKCCDIKLVAIKRRTNQLVSETNYQTTKFFNENFLAIEMIKTQIYMDISVFFGLLTLEFSKILV